MCPLRSMDLFAGFGGFIEGLQNSGSVKTKWDVRIDHYAAEAFKLNHGDVLVLVVLSRTILTNTFLLLRLIPHIDEGYITNKLQNILSKYV